MRARTATPASGRGSPVNQELPQDTGAISLAGVHSDNYLIIDRMNYHHADRIYYRYGWNDKNTVAYFECIGSEMANECRALGIECRSVY